VKNSGLLLEFLHLLEAKYACQTGNGIDSMAMDREKLGRTIDVGRTSTLKCFETSLNIAAITAGIAEDDPRGPMFKNRYLNDAILLKVVESEMARGKRSFKIETLVYFPYNHKNVYEGGDSILVKDRQRTEKLKMKCGLDPTNEEKIDDYRWDIDMLDMLNTLPTLDPFLLKCKAQQTGIEEKLNPAYFNITIQEWKRLQAPIREKIEALVRRALSGGTEEASEKVEEHVSRFLKKIWEARDIVGIEDFVKSLDLTPERAPEMFFAWKGICYYQSQYAAFEPAMRDLFAWVGDPKKSLPSDMKALNSDTKEQIISEMTALKARMRENYITIQTTLNTYEDSYQQFIEQGKPAAFIGFLSEADKHYVELAACLSSTAHAINLLQDQMRRIAPDQQLQNEQHRLLLDCLLGVFGIDDPGQSLKLAS